MCNVPCSFCGDSDECLIEKKNLIYDNWKLTEKFDKLSQEFEEKFNTPFWCKETENAKS